jgi:hypothetical protein
VRHEVPTNHFGNFNIASLGHARIMLALASAGERRAAAHERVSPAVWRTEQCRSTPARR